jgi:hypothetical protein
MSLSPFFTAANRHRRWRPPLHRALPRSPQSRRTTADHGTTVWWDAHAVGRPRPPTKSRRSSPSHPSQRLSTVDIHRAASATGIGTAAVANEHVHGRRRLAGAIGIMHTDYQGIGVARAWRNPCSSRGKPAGHVLGAAFQTSGIVGGGADAGADGRPARIHVRAVVTRTVRGSAVVWATRGTPGLAIRRNEDL